MDGRFRNGMDEIYGMGTEADAAIGVAALGTILEVAPDRQTDVCELAANLMVSPRVEIHFHECVILVRCQRTKVENSLLGIRLLTVVSV